MRDILAVSNLAPHYMLLNRISISQQNIETNCSHFKTAPLGTEFDHISALETGAEFTSLTKAPVNDALAKRLSTKGMSKMPGYDGHYEFISGVTKHSDYLWSVCINPFLKMVYLTLVPFNAIERQADASSVNYWMHSGGRDFAPWADYQSRVDRNYALGMETSVGASCLGLDWAKQHPEYIGKPTFSKLDAGASLRFPCIDTIFEIDLDASLEASQVRQSICQQVEQHIATLDTRFSAFNALT